MNDSFISPQPGSRYSISGGNLRISQLNKEEDAGIYQCLASNSFGTILSREASLHIACESVHFKSFLSLKTPKTPSMMVFSTSFEVVLVHLRTVDIFYHVWKISITH